MLTSHFLFGNIFIVYKKKIMEHTYDGYNYQTEEGFIPLLTQMGAVYKEDKDITFKHTELNSFFDEGQEDPVDLWLPFCGCCENTNG